MESPPDIYCRGSATEDAHMYYFIFGRLFLRVKGRPIFRNTTSTFKQFSVPVVSDDIFAIHNAQKKVKLSIKEGSLPDQKYSL